MWISIIIAVTILALLIAIVTTVIFVSYKRRQSLRSLRHDLAVVIKDDHPIYEEISPIEILQWYTEAVRSGEITADGCTHQYESVDLPITATTRATLASSTGHNVSLKIPTSYEVVSVQITTHAEVNDPIGNTEHTQEGVSQSEGHTELIREKVTQ